MEWMCSVGANYDDTLLIVLLPSIQQMMQLGRQFIQVCTLYRYDVIIFSILPVIVKILAITLESGKRELSFSLHLPQLVFSSPFRKDRHGKAQTKSY